MALEFTLNGRALRVDDVDPQQTLLCWLRAQGLTGTKEGCAEGECGACAVAVLEPDAEGRPALHAINSCLVPLPALHGRTLITIEGVARASGALHPVQRGLVESGGSQCGYCTPGFAISLYCEYYRAGRAGYDPEAIAGNLCRCTGYRPIIDVARQLPQPAVDDPVLDLLRAELPERPALSHEGQGRRYVRPRDLSEALACARQSDGATFIAGGTDLMVYANLRGRRDRTLIAIDGIEELLGFHISASELTLGAALPLCAVERRLGARPELQGSMLAQLWPLFSSRLIRNRATLGGNLATASPIGDAAPVLLALDASLTLIGEEGSRRMPLREFFTGYRQTALRSGELIASVHVPLPLSPLQRFYKVSKRRLDDISTVSAAFTLQLDAQARVQQLRIAYGGIAETPLRAIAAEQLALGEVWNDATIAALCAELDRLANPIDDLRGSAGYRRAMVRNLLRKFHVESCGTQVVS